MEQVSVTFGSRAEALRAMYADEAWDMLLLIQAEVFDRSLDRDVVIARVMEHVGEAFRCTSTDLWGRGTPSNLGAAHEQRE